MQECAVSQTQQETFCITKSGTKYHRCDCSYVNASAKEITLAEAEEKNYTPCSICLPEDPSEGRQVVTPKSLMNKDQSELAKDKKSDRKTSQRCAALTKSGRRCKRKASEGSDKCWQHQEK